MKGSQSNNAGVTSHSGAWVAVTDGTWAALASFVIPNEEHECYFVQVNVRRQTLSLLLAITLRARAVIDGATNYFPSSNKDTCPQIITEGITSKPGRGSVFLTVPRNLAGLTLFIDAYTEGGNSDNYICTIRSWGQTIHYHR